MQIKNITGKLLAFGVRLHSQAIRAQVKRALNAAQAAKTQSERTSSDLKLVQARLNDDISAEIEAFTAYDAAVKQAGVELAALPSVQGYTWTVRAAPPFGAVPQVIDKRK